MTQMANQIFPVGLLRKISFPAGPAYWRIGVWGFSSHLTSMCGTRTEEQSQVEIGRESPTAVAWFLAPAESDGRRSLGFPSKLPFLSKPV